MTTMDCHAAGGFLTQALTLYSLPAESRVLEVPTLNRDGGLGSGPLTHEFSSAFAAANQLVSCAELVKAKSEGSTPISLVTETKEGARQTYLTHYVNAVDDARLSRELLLMRAPSPQETSRRLELFCHAQENLNNRRCEMQLAELRHIKDLGEIKRPHGYALDLIRSFRRQTPWTLDVSFRLVGFNSVACWQNRVNRGDETGFLVSMTVYANSWPEFYALFHELLPLQSEQDFDAATALALSACLYEQDRSVSALGFKLKAAEQSYLIFPSHPGLTAILDERSKQMRRGNIRLEEEGRQLESATKWGQRATPAFSLISDPSGVTMKACCPLDYDGLFLDFLRGTFDRASDRIQQEVDMFDREDAETQASWLRSALLASGYHMA